MGAFRGELQLEIVPGVGGQDTRYKIVLLVQTLMETNCPQRKAKTVKKTFATGVGEKGIGLRSALLEQM